MQIKSITKQIKDQTLDDFLKMHDLKSIKMNLETFNDIKGEQEVNEMVSGEYLFVSNFGTLKLEINEDLEYNNVVYNYK